jgi:glutaminase
MRDFPALLEAIATAVRPLTAQGKVATYIPALAAVPADRFGMAVATLDGRLTAVGDAEVPFSIQSISKVFTLTLALRAVGDRLWQRVGREPSGNAFNSLVQLETEQGVPRNPLINAGAHVVADILLEADPCAGASLLRFVRQRARNAQVAVDADVARSEAETGFRNRALANFLKGFGSLRGTVDAVLDFYFNQCALAMTCSDLARAFSFLANRGVCPWTGEVVLASQETKRVNALLLTCGTYDEAGEFAYEVGIPAKSGVGGGIVGIVPGQLAVAVWSPALNAKGNSLAGSAALEQFTMATGLSIF